MDTEKEKKNSTIIQQPKLMKEKEKQKETLELIDKSAFCFLGAIEV